MTHGRAPAARPERSMMQGDAPEHPGVRPGLVLAHPHSVGEGVGTDVRRRHRLKNGGRRVPHDYKALERRRPRMRTPPPATSSTRAFFVSQVGVLRGRGLLSSIP